MLRIFNKQFNRRTDKRTGLARKQNNVHIVPVANHLFTMFYKPYFQYFVSYHRIQTMSKVVAPHLNNYGDHFCQIVVKSDFK